MTRLAFDPQGHLTAVWDAMGYAEHVRLDRMGRLLSVKDVLGGLTRLRRDCEDSLAILRARRRAAVPLVSENPSVLEHLRELGYADPIEKHDGNGHRR